MTAVPFDTLRYAAALKSAGVPDAHAKAEAEALADALRQASQDLATKADIAELRMATKLDIAGVRGAHPSDAQSPATNHARRDGRL